MEEMFTSNAQQILHKAQKLAKKKNNYQIEPEHLLLAIFESNVPLIEKNLSKEEKNIFLSLINQKIDSLAKGENTNPVPSHRFTNLLNNAQMNRKEITELDLLEESLKNFIISQNNLSNDNSSPEKIKSKLEGLLNQAKNSLTPTLDDFGLELVAEAISKPQDPVIGRIEEIRSIIEILSKKKKSNPMLLGPAGVGKTAIVSGLAQLIAKNEAPGLQNYKIYEIDVSSMVANTGIRGQFEERIKKVVKEAEQPNIILFIDEIHTTVSAGSTQGALDFSNILKPSLAAGRIKIIGATTHDEYRKYIETDAAFARRFVKVMVNEPNIADSITMIRGVRNRIETHHGIKIEDSAIVFAVKMAKKYIPNRKLPDIGFDLIDTACASALIELASEPQEILNMRNQIWSLELEKAAIERDHRIKSSGDSDQEKFTIDNSKKNTPNIDENVMKRTKDDLFERIELINTQIESLKKSLIPLEENHARERKSVIEAKNLKTKIENVQNRIEEAKRKNETLTVLDLQTDVLPVLKEQLKKIEGAILITANHVANIISRWTGVPITRLTLKESERLLNLNQRLKNKIFGQDIAVNQISECILRSRVGLAQKNRPMGAFLFLGPSGVGKTELTKAIAYELFDNSQSLVFLDMSDYSNETSITKLIGVSAGYIGYAEGGSLTEPVKEKPYNVVLFDELDLAHPKVINILYQLLEEGRVTDGKRNVIDFTNTVIVMTSNIGTEEIMAHHLQKRVQKDENNQNGTLDDLSKSEKEKVEQKLYKQFGTALINRIDSICYFNPLDLNDLKNILNYQLGDLNKELADKKIQLFLSDAVKENEVKLNYRPELGARPLKRAIESKFINAITQIILSGMQEKIVIQAYMPEEVIDQDGIFINDYVYKVTELEK
ncbi:Chaperone HSP104, ATP-dependent Clp protease [Pseudoloma neurophilia]|uniref:Chaperone HSP104, ATP-dependent Clp protease n=1 Tax=Pseudoloma neurophilia TaxID=146866 RepID=A0A0R0M5S5_9MICR|nr:Chaperone HSP104, ATP-dependent Clp protease [Pseudoloma neurophilia]